MKIDFKEKELSDVDRRILKTIQHRGRVTNLELAKKINMSPSATLERVRRLEEKKIICGYRTIIDPIRLGLKLEAMVLITLARHQVESIDGFEESIRSIPEVSACWHLTGQYDYLVHLRVRDVEHLGRVIKHTIGGIPGVEKQETLLALSVVKEDQGISLDAITDDEDKEP
jgi:Lrp/AsnC family leucine-responsive transcriptional regulator